MSRRRSERGSALLLTLVVLVVAWSASMLVAAALSMELRSARDDARRLRLAALLDSACAEALAELAQDPYAVGFATHEFGGGTIGSVIGGIAGPERDVDLAATLGGMERRARAHVVLGASGPAVVAWRPEGVGARPAN